MSDLPRAICWWTRPPPRQTEFKVEIRPHLRRGPLLVYEGPTKKYDVLAPKRCNRPLDDAVRLDLDDPHSARRFAQTWGLLGLDRNAAGFPRVESLSAWQEELRRLQNANYVRSCVANGDLDLLADLEDWALHDFGDPRAFQRHAPGLTAADWVGDKGRRKLALGFLKSELHAALEGETFFENEVNGPNPAERHDEEPSLNVHMATHVRTLRGALWYSLAGPLVEPTCPVCGHRFISSENSDRKLCSHKCAVQLSGGSKKKRESGQ